jgi:hypothetical protein
MKENVEAANKAKIVAEVHTNYTYYKFVNKLIIIFLI